MDGRDDPRRRRRTIAFSGFYGDYVVEVAGRTLAFELVKGKTNYELR